VTGAVRHLAAFDVDGTLTTRDCVVPFLRRIAGTRRLVFGIARDPTHLVASAVRHDRDALKQLAARATFRGRPLGDVLDQGASFARLVHESWLRSDSVHALDRHRVDGDLVVLVSASFEVYLEPLGELLGVDHVIGTRLTVDPSGVLTGALDGANCRGPEKVRRLHEWLDRSLGGRSNVRVVAYGDSPGDRELLADAEEARWVGTRS
jgi:phosphatidylglycerophosphatase C